MTVKGKTKPPKSPLQVLRLKGAFSSRGNGLIRLVSHFDFNLSHSAFENTAADMLEEYALYKRGNSRAETAAIRYMQTFSQKPFSTWNTIHQTLVPYIQQVKGSLAFVEIQRVHGLFMDGDFENDAPLSGAYLIGYYCERAHIEQMVSNLKKENEEECK